MKNLNKNELNIVSGGSDGTNSTVLDEMSDDELRKLMNEVEDLEDSPVELPKVKPSPDSQEDGSFLDDLYGRREAWYVGDGWKYGG